MATTLLDSNVLIGARVSSDQHHDVSRAITTGIDTGELPTGRIPEDVLSEVLNFLHARAGKQVAVETLDVIQASIDLEVDETTKTDFDAGRSLFRQYDGLSFTDAVIVAYMRGQVSNTCTASTTISMQSMTSPGSRRQRTRSPSGGTVVRNRQFVRGT